MFTLPAEVQDYLAQYRYKIELHAHTSPGSGCSELPPREFLSRLRTQGYHAVVITNHFPRALHSLARRIPSAPISLIITKQSSLSRNTASPFYSVRNSVLRKTATTI